MKVLIQVAAGSCERRIYDESTLEYLETRTGRLPYLYPYGFIPGTLTEDGGGVDVYLITKEALPAGSLVDCEPVGLLLQYEQDEVDHKVLAALPGETVSAGPELLQELQAFIRAIFGSHPVRVGPLLPVEAACEYIQQCTQRAAQGGQDGG